MYKLRRNGHNCWNVYYHSDGESSQELVGRIVYRNDRYHAVDFDRRCSWSNDDLDIAVSRFEH